MENIEVWKDVVGYEGLYQISSEGNVKGLKRVVKHSTSQFLTLQERKLSVACTAQYKSIELNSNGKPKSKLIHRLIAEAFIPNPKNKPQVNHINGIKKDNTVENLEWCTAKENAIHAIETGLKKRGGCKTNSKLTDEKVAAIKRLLRINPKVNKYKLAEKVGVVNGVIYQIIKGTSWRHIN